MHALLTWHHIGWRLLAAVLLVLWACSCRGLSRIGQGP